MGKQWQPLESNPEVLNDYFRELGIKKGLEAVDIYSLDPNDFSFVPQPLIAIIVLFPLADNKESPIESDKKFNGDAVFIPQTIGNACGTMAILHALLNNTSKFEIGDPLKSFYHKVSSVSPEMRSEILENNEELESLHLAYSSQGQSEVLEASAEVDFHYTTFTIVNNHLVEFDGRKKQPMDFGPCNSPEQMLEMTSGIIRKIINEKPSYNLSLMGLVLNS